MTTMTRNEHELIRLHARIIVLEEEINSHWSWRKWYRTTAREMFGHRWDDLMEHNDRQIHDLIEDLRRARRRAEWWEAASCRAAGGTDD